MGKRDKELNLGLPDEIYALVEAQADNDQEAIRQAIKTAYGDSDPGESIDARIAQIESRVADLDDDIEEKEAELEGLRLERQELIQEREELVEERPAVVEKAESESIEESFDDVVAILDDRDEIFDGHPAVESAAEEHTGGDTDEYLRLLWEATDVSKDEIKIVNGQHLKQDW